MPDHHDYTTSRVGFASHTLEVVFLLCVRCKEPLPDGALYCPACGKKQAQTASTTKAEARERDGDSVQTERQAKKAMGGREKRRYRRILRNENGGYGSAGGHTGGEIAGLV